MKSILINFNKPVLFQHFHSEEDISQAALGTQSCFSKDHNSGDFQQSKMGTTL